MWENHHNYDFLFLYHPCDCAASGPCERLLKDLGHAHGFQTSTSYMICFDWVAPLCWSILEMHHWTICRSSWWCRRGIYLNVLPLRLLTGLNEFPPLSLLFIHSLLMWLTLLLGEVSPLIWKWYAQSCYFSILLTYECHQMNLGSLWLFSSEQCPGGRDTKNYHPIP